MSSINYAEFGRKMESHDMVTHKSTQPGQMSFEIPDDRFAVLRHISSLLDEYGMEIGSTAHTDDGITFSVVTQ